MAYRAYRGAAPSPPACYRVEATGSCVPMGSSSAPSPSPSLSPPRPPPPLMIGRAGNLTVFITPPSPASTPRSPRPSVSPRSDFSTPTSRTAPLPAASACLQKRASSPSFPPPVMFSTPAPPIKGSTPPVQVPPPQYEKASTGGKDGGSASGFFWDAVVRVQEAHANLDEYVANWFGLDQSKYQWALNDYYESTGKEVETLKGRKPKELTTTKV